ncbi:BTAD domain-containing putative transcriptional regulator [Streptomyces sp. NPDC002825]|uniref:BTAD domain-containing putative transcriptional regulator n=1 Tax=Streptomyces sp. NPDC002825 TaxID=3154666 RepID=UPI003320A1D6
MQPQPSYRVLGPCQALRADDGTEAALSGARLRALLTALAAAGGRAVGPGALIDQVWPDGDPADDQDRTAALQALVGRLRRALGREAVVSAPGGGYRLAAGPDAVDLHRFERLAAEGAAALADGRAERAAALLDEALGLWRGPALADLPGRDTDPLVVRVEQRHAQARRDRLAAEVALGRAADALAPLAALAAGQPLDEPLQALRIRALRAAGRPAEALAAYEEVRESLAERLGTDPGPELRSLHAELLTEDGPVPAPSRRALPAPLTSFIGRAEELGSLAAAWEGRRLVTLTGPGGVGKTRLALEAAGTYDGPVHLAELASVREESTVAAAVLSALGARETQLWHTPAVAPVEPRDRFAALVEHCAGRRMLLVLDNCEHVVAEAAELAQALLTRCPGVTVLATSREPLGVPGEGVRPLGPLPVDMALRLLGERGAAARPGFSVAEDPEAADEICRRLDGLPLAIELAAARLRMLSARQIAERLDDRFRLLTSGARTVLPRQQTLRAVVDWSWDLLDETERAVLRRLAVFTGGCDLTAAETVCGSGPDPQEAGPAGAVLDGPGAEALNGRRVDDPVRGADMPGAGLPVGLGGGMPDSPVTHAPGGPVADVPQVRGADAPGRSGVEGPVQGPGTPGADMPGGLGGAVQDPSGGPVADVPRTDPRVPGPDAPGGAPRADAPSKPDSAAPPVPDTGPRGGPDAGAPARPRTDSLDARRPGASHPHASHPDAPRPGVLGVSRAHGPHVSPADVLDVLGALVDKSLVVAAPGGDGMRFRLLETVAEYAGERLDEAGEREVVARRHLTYYRELARRTDPELRGPGQLAAIELFEREHGNLRGALRTALALGDEQEMLCLVHALSWFWQLRNHQVDARTWAAEAGRLGPDPFQEPVRPAEPLDGRCLDVPPPWTGERLWEARRGGRLYALATEGGEGATALERPETRARLTALVAAYRPGLPQTCRQPGTMWYFARLMTGELSGLDETLAQIVDACRAHGPGWDLGFALLMRAKLAGQGDDAAEALALFETARDSWGIAESLAARGEAYEREGRLKEAAADFERATDAATRVGARSQVPVFTARLAAVRLRLAPTGDAEAERLLAEAADEAGQWGAEAAGAGRLLLAQHYGHTGRTGLARAQLSLLEGEFGDVTPALFWGLVGGTWAWLDCLDGAYDRALERLARAVVDVETLAHLVAPHLVVAQFATAAWARGARGGPGDAETGARLLGAYDAHAGSDTGGGFRPFTPQTEAAIRAGAEEALSAALPAETYTRLYEEGTALSLRRAAGLVRDQAASP